MLLSQRHVLNSRSSAALALFKAARFWPLTPLLLTPLFAAAAVPIPHAALLVSRGLCPSPGPLVTSVLLFAILHEAERVGVATASESYHPQEAKMSFLVASFCAAPLRSRTKTTTTSASVSSAPPQLQRAASRREACHLNLLRPLLPLTPAPPPRLARSRRSVRPRRRSTSRTVSASWRGRPRTPSHTYLRPSSS